MSKLVRWTAAGLAVLALCWWAYYPQAKAAPLLAYGGGTSILNITPLPEDLRPSQEAVRVSYQSFLNQRFFAAFAIGSEGRYGWVGGRHSREIAHFGALERCGTGCVIFLENLPNHYQPDLAGRSVAQKVVDKLDLTPEAAVQPRYYALAANGAWAIEGQQDEGRLATWSVVQRCNNFAYPDRLIPVLVNGCALFYGSISVAPEKSSTD
ncbi:hypothetical protein [Cypionkella psychrotolerans]|uniref:hypothetical protein n=1 Tax=Cypionkella psychrotolerans TaxID=1678131 RepID=UPI0006B49A48|nr:hypothetical protein [Cypionkella psychrotolerans]